MPVLGFITNLDIISITFRLLLYIFSVKCKMKKILLILIALSFCSSFSNAEVYNVEINSQEDVLDGKEFGEYGSYELIRGKIHFRFDPANPANGMITDILLAERDAEGYVLAWSELIVLQPKDPEKRRGIGLVEVSNRGGKFSPRYFNRASGSQLRPNKSEDFGDDLLMRQGLTVIWIGWEFDVPHENEILRLRVPKARNKDGSSIHGWVRSDWMVTEYTQVLGLAHRNQVPYPATDWENEGNVLTVRDGRDSERSIVDRSKWEFANLNKRGKPKPDSSHIVFMEGFQPGKIYELVYRSKDPSVVGLGLAAIRDVISYAKYYSESPFPVEYGLAAGVSQTGRFLRQFVYQGFNKDEQNRTAYDGLMIITAGAGRGSFNHRFAQPSRDGHRYSAFFYPTDIFPFSGRNQQEIVTEKTDGLFSLELQEHQPKVFYINTGYEYWGRAASLIHMSVDGTEDIRPLDNERIYHLASGQHFVERYPPSVDAQIRPGLYRGNPLDFSVNYRSLLVKLVDWVEEEASPPGSRYPLISQGTLVGIEEVNFPEITGISKPSVIHRAYPVDYGSKWVEGIIENQPPLLGEPYIAKVSQVDNLGNEVGGIRNVELSVPLATYTPWNLRINLPGDENELTDFRGSYIPLSTNEDQRLLGKDPRPSIMAIYSTRESYLQRVNKAALKLVEEGFLLEEDIEYVMNRSETYWNWIHSR
jgi:hypothetical protein